MYPSILTLKQKFSLKLSFTFDHVGQDEILKEIKVLSNSKSHLRYGYSNQNN